MKRYLRLDIEYEFDDASALYMVGDNIKRVLEEDMPYVKIVFSRDSPRVEELDRPKSYKRW